MYKKVIIFIGIMAVVIGAASLVYTQYIRGLLPALGPAQENIAEQIRDGNENRAGENKTDFPLQLPEGFRIDVLAEGLTRPRDLAFDGKNYLLASLPDDGLIVRFNVSTASDDQQNSAVASEPVIENLENPHGMAFHNDKLFIAEETRVSRYAYDVDSGRATFEKKLIDLPAGGRHSTRTIAFEKNGRMFVSIGSTCDTCEEKDERHGSVIVSDSEGAAPRVFAKGLRNAVFIAMNPGTSELWGTEMSRDLLGDDIPPDEIDIIKERHYGWPYCYGDRVWDKQFGKKNASFCVDDTISPAFQIQAHSAPLGLAFIDSPQFPEDWQGDLLVAYHGSWNRSVPTGYKIVRLEISKDDRSQIIAQHEFISGWIKDNSALGRPVDVEFGARGELYVSDDKAGIVYKVEKQI